LETLPIIPLMPDSGVIETDGLVIGAGPVGLFSVFQLGLQGIGVHVVDVLDEPGGQCVELYPDKPIYDIAGLPACTGRELTQNLLKQIAPFAPCFHFGQQINTLQRQADGRWLANTQHLQFLTRCVVIAAGVGAFVPKELKVDGLAQFLGSQLFYRSAPPSACAGKTVVIVGGDDAAVDNAIALAEDGPNQAKSVTLVHRRDVLQASANALARLAALRHAQKINFVTGQITGIQTQDKYLCCVEMSTPDDEIRKLSLDTLLVCQGVSPKLGPIAQWGLAMERKQVNVNPETFATSEPGIFAVGDIVTYPGKRKLIVCGFHEATLAAYAAAALLHPESPTVQQYTSSSGLLQQRLGVAQRLD
jgi:thioredoxin reductase (NADPH)